MRKSPPTFACFDVDGVLIDSLPQHLQMCRDEAALMDLQVTIPSVAEMRKRISAGVVVSPMVEFFKAVGFPDDCLAKAVVDYKANFASRYAPSQFPGVREMLVQLNKAHIPMGLVTSNVRENVIPVLRDCMPLFNPACLRFDEPGQQKASKTHALLDCAQRLGVEPADSCYVGDQPSDASAALHAGFQFLGVTYGWGITGADAQYDVANGVSDIARILLGAVQ